MRHTFEFDAVYGADVSQATVFEFTGKQIVEDVFQGYNGTIFAYGQTGSGKARGTLKGLVRIVMGDLRLAFPQFSGQG